MCLRVCCIRIRQRWWWWICTQVNMNLLYSILPSSSSSTSTSSALVCMLWFPLLLCVWLLKSWYSMHVVNGFRCWRRVEGDENLFWVLWDCEKWDLFAVIVMKCEFWDCEKWRMREFESVESWIWKNELELMNVNALYLYRWWSFNYALSNSVRSFSNSIRVSVSLLFPSKIMLNFAS